MVKRTLAVYLQPLYLIHAPKTNDESAIKTTLYTCTIVHTSSH